MPNDATNDRITWPVEYIRLTRDRYRSHGYDDYRWVHNDDPSGLVKPSKPLGESREAGRAAQARFEASTGSAQRRHGSRR